MKFNHFFFGLVFIGLTMQLISQENAQKIDEIVKAYIQPFSGMAIMVIKDGEIEYEQVLGYADMERKIPVTSNTRFNLGGLSRQLTAMAVFHLMQNNQLSLNEKVADIIAFPEFGKDITIYHLLSHTSGLPSYMNLVELVRNTPVTHKEVLILLDKYGKTDFEPGTLYRFSNTDYALLALVVERKSGMRFDRYIHRRILRPMGIGDQVVAQRKMNRIKNRATGYVFRGEEGFVKNDPGLNTLITGEAGVYLSIEEYRRFLREMRSGSLLNEETRKLLFSPVNYNSGNQIFPQVSPGWMFGQQKQIRYIYQSGPNNAFTNYVLIIPNMDLTIILFSNQAGLFQLLDKIVYPIANMYTEDAFKDRIR